ncbi:hypothetical protein D3C71_1736630 [compost metagenome]
MEQHCQQPGRQRHDQVMQKDPRGNRARAGQYAFKVIEPQRDAHGEHDQHQQRADVGADPGKGGGRAVGGDGEQYRPQRE